MAYVKVTPPSVVYHLTRMENLDSILDDGQIRRFEDSECWFCESLPKMKAYMEQTVMSRFVFQSAVIRFRVMKSSVLSQEAEVFPFTGQTVSIF